MTTLDLVGAIARVVGGTQPDVTKDTWFSGRDTGDSTGVSGIAGCFSLPPEVLQDTPVGVVLPGPWRPLEPEPHMGREFSEDSFRVLVLVGHDDLTAQWRRLLPFRDTVPPAFNSHMTLFGVNSNTVMSAKCREGRPYELPWGGNAYMVLDFTVRVQRAISVQYSI